MPNIVSRIVEVCVFRTFNGEAQYLLLRRSRDQRLYPGIWQIITGKIDKGERAVDAAMREVIEETGLTPRRLWRLPFVNSFYDVSEDLVHLCPHFAAEVPQSATVRVSSEHDEFAWCDVERTQTLLPWTGQRKGVMIVQTHILPETEEARLLEIPPDIFERKSR